MRQRRNRRGLVVEAVTREIDHDEKLREEENDAAALMEVLATVYDDEGVEIWLAHAATQGWSLEEQLRRAYSLVDGAYA